MDSVILQGPDALKAAKLIADSFGTEAFDLGPDFGWDTARVWFKESTQDYVMAVLRWKNDGWFDAIGNEFEAKFDGPPFRMGSDISVVGTRL